MARKLKKKKTHVLLPDAPIARQGRYICCRLTPTNAKPIATSRPHVHNDQLTAETEAARIAVKESADVAVFRCVSILCGAKA